MKKILALALAGVLALGSLVGCAPTANSSSSSTSSQTEKTLKVALLLPGSLGDKSFLDAAYSSLGAMEKELGATTKYAEMGSDKSKWQGYFVDMCEQDYDLILTIGDAADTAMHEAAKLYPKQKFINLDSQTAEVPQNVYAMNPKAGEMSYMAGAAAALKAKANGSNHIGFLGAMDSPGINEFLVGYIEGAAKVNPQIKVSTSYVGGFKDPAKAKEQALIMYKTGAEVIFTVAGQSGLGTVDAALDTGKFAIGVDSDQAGALLETAPDKANRIVTSAVKNTAKYTVDAVKRYVAGTLEFGKKERIGFDAGAVGIVKNTVFAENFSEADRKTLDEIEAKLHSGEIKVTDTVGKTNEEVAAIREAVRPK